MKRITVLVPDGQNTPSTAASIIGAVEILNEANAQWKRQGKPQLYKIETAGVTPEVSCNNGLIALRPTTSIADIAATSLIIIPSSSVREARKATPGNQAMMRWIAQQYKTGAEVASICSGAFMLAASGVLDGKRCSTHWMHADVFRQLYPNVNLKEEQLITDEGGIYTNGGAYSFLHLMIYLVEKYYDRPTAIYCSKIFQIDIDRQSQSAFAIFSAQKSHGDEVVRRAQAYIEAHLQNKISMEALATQLAVGRRHFDRRFIKATGNTPLEYAQRVKIEAAKKALETTQRNVAEVMYEVGYSDAKAFRDVFRRLTGMSPLEYRMKYNKEAMSQP